MTLPRGMRSTTARTSSACDVRSPPWTTRVLSPADTVIGGAERGLRAERATGRSVDRQALLDLRRPRGHAALDVLGRRETGALEHRERLRRADTALAVQDDRL